MACQTADIAGKLTPNPCTILDGFRMAIMAESAGPFDELIGLTRQVVV